MAYLAPGHFFSVFSISQGKHLKVCMEINSCDLPSLTICPSARTRAMSPEWYQPSESTFNSNNSGMPKYALKRHELHIQTWPISPPGSTLSSSSTILISSPGHSVPIIFHRHNHPFYRFEMLSYHRLLCSRRSLSNSNRIFLSVTEQTLENVPHW